MAQFRKNKQIYALLTAILLTAVLFLSVFFIATHAKHQCTGEGCYICAEMEACASTLRLLSEAAGGGTAVIFANIVVQKFLISYRTGLYLRPVSLVSLKNRLDN